MVRGLWHRGSILLGKESGGSWLRKFDPTTHGRQVAALLRSHQGARGFGELAHGDAAQQVFFQPNWLKFFVKEGLLSPEHARGLRNTKEISDLVKGIDWKPAGVPAKVEGLDQRLEAGVWAVMSDLQKAGYLDSLHGSVNLRQYTTPTGSKAIGLSGDFDVPVKTTREALDKGKFDYKGFDSVFQASVNKWLIDAFPTVNIKTGGVGKMKDFNRQILFDNVKKVEAVFPHGKKVAEGSQPVGGGHVLGIPLKTGHHIVNMAGVPIQFAKPLRQLQESMITTTAVQPRRVLMDRMTKEGVQESGHGALLWDKTRDAILSVIPDVGRLKDRLRFVWGARAFADKLSRDKSEKAHELIDDLAGDIWGLEKNQPSVSFRDMPPIRLNLFESSTGSSATPPRLPSLFADAVKGAPA